MKTYSQKPADVTRKWYLLDASTAPMGRLAVVAAQLLLGKGKPTFSPHVDGGDYVVVVNADKMVVTGNKEDKKVYHNYSGYPSGLRSRPLKDVDNSEALAHSIQGMLPANKLRDGRMARLKIYAGFDHQHTAQNPTTYEIKKGGK